MPLLPGTSLLFIDPTASTLLLAASTDKSEYSRYTDDYLVTVRLALRPAGGGETLTVTLARTDRYGTVGTVPLTLVAGQTAATATFDLRSLVDVDGQNRVIAGDYSISVSDGLHAIAAAQIAVSLVTVKELRSRWTYGATLQAFELMAPKFQPQIVTGVHIDEVSRTHSSGIFPLVYTAPAGLTAATLSWAGGTPQPLPIGATAPYQMALLDKRASSAMGSGSYVTVTVDPLALPVGAASEMIIIDRTEMSDRDLVMGVRAATSWIESQMGWWLEPKLAVTSLLSASYPTYDVIVDPATMYTQLWSPQWTLIDTPLRQIQKVYELDGYMNKGRVTQIDLGWVQWNEMAGEIELVPTNGQALSIIFTGSPFFFFPAAYKEIPNFWHFALLAGLRDLIGDRAAFREAIAKKAAMEILIAASSAYRGGVGSESISRDGISTSHSYIQGIYAPQIREYETWLADQIPALRQRFGGIPVAVIQ